MKAKKKFSTIDMPVGFRTKKEKREFYLTILVTVIIGVTVAILNFK